MLGLFNLLLFGDAGLEVLDCFLFHLFFGSETRNGLGGTVLVPLEGARGGPGE